MSEWSKETCLTTGIDIIDNQNSCITECVNELGLVSVSRDQVRNILTRLKEHANVHFEFEEFLMETACYPLADSHKEAHHSFLVLIEKYRRRHDAGEAIARQLQVDLRIWQSEHIEVDDGDYAFFVTKLLKKSWLGDALGKMFE